MCRWYSETPTFPCALLGAAYQLALATNCLLGFKTDVQPKFNHVDLSVVMLLGSSSPQCLAKPASILGASLLKLGLPLDVGP